MRLPPAMREFADSRSAGREPGPREQATEQEQRVGLDVNAPKSGQHHREHDGVDNQQKQRVDKRPKVAENRPSISRLELADDERLNQPSVSDQLTEIGQHL